MAVETNIFTVNQGVEPVPLAVYLETEVVPTSNVCSSITSSGP